MKPKVSIIVPVYNVEQYLDRCMESLLNQTLKDIEIILVDDGSPDNCPQMCDEYANKDSRVKVVHKANAGLGYARNSGLDVASGEYVAFVDSDDYVELDAYQTMYNEAVRVNADYVCCGYKRIAHGKCVWEYRGIPKNKIQTIKEQDCYKILAGMLCDNKSQGLYRHYDFAVWHGIYRMSLIDLHNIRFCSERDYISEDIIFHIFLIPCCNVVRVIPKALYNYCMNEGTLTTKYKEGRLDAVLKLYDYIIGLISKLQIEHGIADLLRHNAKGLLLDKIFSTIAYEVRYNKTDAFSALKNICNHHQVKTITKTVDTTSLSLKQKVLFYCLSLRFYLGFYLIFRRLD